MSARDRITKAILGASYARFALVCGQIVAVPVLVTGWGMASYGTWITLTSLASYLTYSAVGVAQVLRSDMAMNDSVGSDAAARASFQTVFAMVALTTTFALGTFLALLWLLPVRELFNISDLSVSDVRSIAAAMAFATVILLVSGTVSAGLAALGHYGMAQAIDATRTTIEFTSLAIAVGLFRAPPALAALIYPLSATLTLLFSTIALHRIAPYLFNQVSLNIGILRRLMAPMAGSLLLSVGYTSLGIQAPRLIIAATLGPVQVAVFSLATMMFRIARIPIEVPAFATTVEVSRAYGSGNLLTARNLMAGSTQFTLWLALLIVPCVVVLGPIVGDIWTLGRTHVSVGILLVLAFATMFYAISLPAQETLMAANRLSTATVAVAAMALPFCVGLYFAAKAFNLVGAAAAVVALEAAFAFITVRASLRLLDFPLEHYVRAICRPPVSIILGFTSSLRDKVANRSASTGEGD